MIWSSLNTKIVLAIAGLGLGALAVSGYVRERERAVRAETVAETQAVIQKGLTSQIADLQKQMGDREAQYQADKRAQDARFAQAQNPTQIAALVAQVMGLKQPITISTPPATAQNPNPVPIATVSTLDAPQVKAYVQECETCKLQLPKLQADNADLKSQLTKKDATITSVIAQRDEWKTTAQGGTKWQRFKKAAKYLGIGAVAGAAALCGTGHCKL